MEKSTYRLPTYFYQMPKFATDTIEKKDLKNVLLNTGGNIIAHGVVWDIKNKHLGAGVYKIYLKRNC